MPKEITRRIFLKRTLGTLVGLFAAGTGAYYYAREIEPKLIEIKKLTISHSLIPKGFDQFKILQFSDTHLGFQYSLKQFEKLVKKINKLQPDLIFFTGDLMDEPNKYTQIDKLSPILKQLNAPFGKFSIYGNHDHGGYGTDLYKQIMDNSGFILLQNQAHEIKMIDQSRIHIVGIDDAMLGKPDLQKPLAQISGEETFKILLCHEPDIADQAIGNGIHLQLSGHSHGGQVKIPFWGPLVTPPLSNIYHEGLYEIEPSSQFKLYVNRGIGTTRLPFRFLSKPELTLIQLNAEKTG